MPWPVFDQARSEELLIKVFREQAPGGKRKQQLYEIATCHDTPMLAAWLAQEAKFDAARGFREQRATPAVKPMSLTSPTTSRISCASATSMD